MLESPKNFPNECLEDYYLMVIAFGETYNSVDIKSEKSMTLERNSIWRRIFGIDYGYFAEVIAVNPSTNKLYVSDSMNNVLYEIDA